jgi:hypothetical protein
VHSSRRTRGIFGTGTEDTRVSSDTKACYTIWLVFGTADDSPIFQDEHLMLIFHDVLLHDETVTMTLPLTERRECLKTIIHKIPGYALTSEWKIQDFSKSNADRVLMHQFVDSVAKRTEGLVLKPADSPFFSFGSDEYEDHVGYFIKIKKDYLQDFDESETFAISPLWAEATCQKPHRISATRH